MAEIFVGFADEPVKTNSWMYSKIGGVPIFPDDGIRSIVCSGCSNYCSLIAQIYCPVDSNNHRLLYIFTCLDKECQGNSKTEWKVFRLIHPIVKLEVKPKVKKVESFELDNDWGDGDDGGWGSAALTKPDPVTEISKDIEELTIHHSALILINSKTQRLAKWLDAFYVRVQEEKGTKASCELEHAKLLLAKYEAEHGEVCTNSTNAPSSTGSHLVEDYESTSFADKDHKFLIKFSQTVAHNPRQIIRYQFAGRPLLLQPISKNIPSCPNCGSARVFELQLMPAILSSLKLNKSAIDLDFGVALIFTCGSDCSKSSIFEEYCVIQSV